MRTTVLLQSSSSKRLLSVAESATLKSWVSSLRPDQLKEAAELSYSKSSGPGGQNVNKVNTKATLRLDLGQATSWMPQHVVRQLRQTPFYAESSDSLLLSSMRHRTQAANADDCLEKLYRTVISAAEQDLQGDTSEEQRKRVKGLIRADKARTREGKSKKSEKKQGRGKVAFD